MRKWVFSFCFLVLGFQLVAQDEEPVYTDTVDIYEFFKSAIEGSEDFREIKENDTSYVLSNAFIKVSSSYSGWRIGKSFSDYLRENLKRIELTINHPISIENCLMSNSVIILHFEDFTLNNFKLINNKAEYAFGFSRCNFQNCSFYGNDFGLFRFDSCTFFSALTSYGNKADLRINNCKLNDGLDIRSQDGVIALKNNDIHSNKVHKTYIDHQKKIYYGRRNLEKENSKSALDSTSTSIFSIHQPNEKFADKTIELMGNSFTSKGLVDLKVEVICNTLRIEKNEINGFLDLNDSKISDYLFFKENEIKSGIFIETVIFPEFENIINWKDFDGYKLIIEEKEYSRLGNSANDFPKYISGKKTSDLNSENSFKTLIRKYSKLFQIFKLNGDQESANACYAEMKQVETRRWHYLYTQNPTFETYFRWKLNQFLNFFTDYGTNPAKAVIKSLWVILIFAIFYLFFPSDWDVTNRAEFLNKWKALLSRKLKDESPKSPFAFYLSTVVFLLYTGFIHLLNALTLSLNAFTTLGFGDIPTHGAARYVTIVQGFIGWFLLTIFSVSLINQVLG